MKRHFFCFKSEQRKQTGFTLIEILVTVSVLVMLMSVTTVGFRGSEKNELLRQSARRIGDALQQIETYALSGTQSAYPTAQSYGVHIDAAESPQRIRVFADINTASGIGHWDSNAVDAQGKKDALVGDAQLIDATRRGAAILDKITVAYSLQDPTAVSASCSKDIAGNCIKDANGNYIKYVSSIDVAAQSPSVHFIFSGGSDFPNDPGLSVRQVIFDVKLKDTNSHKFVSLYPLSGRIDTDY